jgi:hypothetical protein
MPGRLPDMLKAISTGLWVHVLGAKLLLSRPSLVWSCLPCALLTVTTALIIWCMCFFLRLPPFSFAVPFAVLLRGTSGVVLLLTSWIWPSISGRAFFAAYSMISPSDAEALLALPVLRGLVSQLLELFFYLVAGAGTLIVAIATAWLWLPMVWLLSPAVIAAVLSVASVTGIVVRLCAPAISLFLRLKSLSRAFAAIAVIVVTSGLLPHSAIDACVEVASGYVASLLHAKQLLAQYSIRTSGQTASTQRPVDASPCGN